MTRLGNGREWVDTSKCESNGKEIRGGGGGKGARDSQMGGGKTDPTRLGRGGSGL